MKSGCSRICLVILAVLMLSLNLHAEESLMVFCGASFSQSMDEVVKAYAAKTKTNVVASYGGVGTLLSQVMLTKQGDLFVVPSTYTMTLI